MMAEGSLTSSPPWVDPSGSIVAPRTAEIGALQPMATGVTAGSDPAGSSRAAIARSSPFPALPSTNQCGYRPAPLPDHATGWFSLARLTAVISATHSEL